MTDRPKAKSGQRVRTLYFSAKISDYQFKKVLWHFTLDHSAAQAAKFIRLSTNSIAAIYTKLRRFFFECGLFRDIYKGGDPREGTGNSDHERFEFNLLDFHLKRVSARHGALDSRMDEPDYHFAESCWRYDFERLKKERGQDSVQRMMYAHLLEFIRRFGPVGARQALTLEQRLAARRLAADQYDRMILWLERNAERFRDNERREALRQIRG